MTARLAVALVVIGLSVMAFAAARAETPTPPSVVELFTSQSCYSCPPAEAYLGRLAGRPDIIALEFHVDYWNDLVYGTAGRWTDVHSDPAYTARQRGYAARQINPLAGGVYTPQMVIDGQAQAVGSRERDVEAAIASARKSPRLDVSLVSLNTGKTELRVSGAERLADRHADRAGDIWLVRFKPRAETKVRAGENRGKVLINHHMVTGMTRLGAWGFDTSSAILDTSSRIFDPVAPGLDEGCAVLIQARGQGPILGAAMCPPTPRKAP